MIGGRGLDWSGFVYVQVAGSSKWSNEPSG